MISLLITGTDTGVGKTWVARALSHALVAAGRRVVAVKPVETGCGGERSHLEDGALLATATGQAEPRAALLRFAAPVAPALAAEREGETDRPRRLVLRIEESSAGAEVLLMEGAGGLLVAHHVGVDRGGPGAPVRGVSASGRGRSARDSSITCSSP